MQTFVPLPAIAASVEVLDNRRLGKMRVEGYQLLRTVLGETQGWRNHPAARMWRSAPAGLAAYAVACSTEWVARGFNDNVRSMVAEVCGRHGLPTSGDDADLPPWWGDPRVHASHRSNLLRKEPEFYRQFGWRDPDDAPYFWPVALDGSYDGLPSSASALRASCIPTSGDASRRGALRARQVS